LSIAAAEAADSAGDEDHQGNGNAADDQQQLQVDLTISACKPISAFAGDHGALDEAAPVAVAGVAFGGRGWKYHLNFFKKNIWKIYKLLYHIISISITYLFNKTITKI